ncbi:MAG: T9SS type A sorting domain-containing protein [Chitinophagales bacterium]
MRTTSKNSIIKYSHFAGAYLLMHSNAIAQVIYTDIEPDIVLENEMDAYSMDLNNDLINDFSFLNRSYDFGGYWTSGSIYYIFFNHNERITGSALFENSFAANTEDFGTTFSDLIRALPFALEEGAIIDGSLTFQPHYHQQLVIKTEFDFSGEIYYYGGHWYPEVFDHYLGVKFEDEDSNNHYGWIRCDVKESGRILVIKDFAYETQENFPIIAGDTSGYVGIENYQNSLSATVYSFNKQLYIHLSESTDTELSIFDLQGKKVLDKPRLSNFEIIPLNNLPTGIYITELRAGFDVFREKISL